MRRDATHRHERCGELVTPLGWRPVIQAGRVETTEQTAARKADPDDPGWWDGRFWPRYCDHCGSNPCVGEAAATTPQWQSTDAKTAWRRFYELAEAGAHSSDPAVRDDVEAARVAWLRASGDELGAALAEDDWREYRDATSSRRRTCSTCRSWSSDHTHDPVTGDRVLTAKERERRQMAWRA
jgi:hypothetical protein